MIKHIKDELTELLLKIGETKLNPSDLFTEEKPSLFLPEGRTIYLEGDHYYIVGVERGKINSEKNLIIRKICFMIFCNHMLLE